MTSDGYASSFDQRALKLARNVTHTAVCDGKTGSQIAAILNERGIPIEIAKFALNEAGYRTVHQRLNPYDDLVVAERSREDISVRNPMKPVRWTSTSPFAVS